MKLTQHNVRAASLPRQVELYWQDNEIINEKNRPGISLMAQANFWNDWRTALENWIENLPRH